MQADLVYQKLLVHNGDVEEGRIESEIGGSDRVFEPEEISLIIDVLAENETDYTDTQAVEDVIGSSGIEGLDSKLIGKVTKWSNQIYEVVAREKKMLHPPASSIMKSYLQGRGAFYLVEGEEGELDAAGYCRLIPVLDKEKANLLGLPEDFPEMFELGTVIVDKNRRQHRIGTKTAAAVHKIDIQAIQEGKIMVFGTTTTHLMMGPLKNLSISEETPNGISLGIPYKRASQLSDGLEYIGASTCVCEAGNVAGQNPNERSLGMHHGKDACEVRTTDTQIYDLASQERFEFDEGSCMMFVSNVEQARQMSSTIEQVTKNLGMTIEQYTEFILAETIEESQAIIDECRINRLNP